MYNGHYDSYYQNTFIVRTPLCHYVKYLNKIICLLAIEKLYSFRSFKTTLKA